MYDKYLALDLGRKRIGVALTDGLKIAAHPHEVFPHTSRRATLAHIGRLVAEHEVSLIVIGLPVTLSGTEGQMAQWVRKYGAALEQALQIPIVFWDESLTSQQAEQALREYGYSRKQMTGKLDAVAAALILQSYLESRRESA